jgi:hypothetical protein
MPALLELGPGRARRNRRTDHECGCKSRSYETISKFFGTKSRPDGTNPNPAERNPNSNPSISFAESRLIKGLRRPPGLFPFLRRFRPQRSAAAKALLVGFGLLRRSFDLRFGVLRSIEQGKSWRRFQDREWRLSTLLASFVRLGGRGPDGAKKANLVVLRPTPRGPGKRHGDC